MVYIESEETKTMLTDKHLEVFNNNLILNRDMCKVSEQLAVKMAKDTVLKCWYSILSEIKQIYFIFLVFATNLCYILGKVRST